MQIRFNGDIADIEEKCSLYDFLQHNGLHEAKGIAVAVNEQVITRKDWPSFSLDPNDSILVIKAAQGG
jgi:sulfur carrier protein